jgi:hypothetical protein
VDEKGATAAGAYLALQKNDWPAALPILKQVRGPVGAAAKRELEALSRGEPEMLVAAGNEGWAIGDAADDTWNTDPLDAAAYKSHAADLYLTALPKLEGKVARDLATARIREAPPARALRLVEADGAAAQGKALGGHGVAVVVAVSVGKQARDEDCSAVGGVAAVPGERPSRLAVAHGNAARGVGYEIGIHQLAPRARRQAALVAG